MKIFLSYASEDRALVEPIYLALRAQGHKVFFDRAELPPGEEYDSRIRQAIEGSQLLIFFLSPAFLDAGSYTLTELHITQKTWEHPAGRLLPVLLRRVDLKQLPPYIKSVTLLEPEGNVTASVADEVHRIALARRRRLLKNFAKGLAAAIIFESPAIFISRTASHRAKQPAKMARPPWSFLPAILPWGMMRKRRFGRSMSMRSISTNMR